MKDMQVFTTEYGAASLILREIPYRAAAYVHIQATLEPEAFIAECAAFCRAAGANQVYACGHMALEQYPLHTAIWQMRCRKESLPDTDAVLLPVQEKNLEQWRSIYNCRMADVPNAAWLTLKGAREMLDKGDGYFVRREAILLGIGRASGGQIDAVVSCVPGAGREVLLALARRISQADVTLEVASANIRAVRLYEQLGFTLTEVLSQWYQIL